MRSIRLMAATTVILSGAWACGDGGGGIEPGEDPVANFTPPACVVNTPCAFTDNSSDDGTIVGWSWNFGDNTPVATTEDATHSYAAAGQYLVTLTVTDDDGNTDDHSAQVTVTGGAANVPPTAGFTFLCTDLSCTFTNTSTDTDGTFTSSWNFGDGATSTELSPTHAYTAAGTYTVTLTVTDDDGATASATQTVTVGSAAGQDCSSSSTASGLVVNCDLTITQRSTVKLILNERSCELGGNRISIAQPVAARQTAWFNACFTDPATVPAEYTLLNDAAAPMVFEAGTVLQVRFTQGTAGAGSPTPGTPAGTIEGTHPTWTINIDDGGNPGGPGEPDFTDLILAVQATPAP